MVHRLSKLVSTAGFLILQSLNGASADIILGNDTIQADPSYMHYNSGFISTPGYVDVSNVVFSTLDSAAKQESTVRLQ